MEITILCKRVLSLIYKFNARFIVINMIRKTIVINMFSNIIVINIISKISCVKDTGSHIKCVSIYQ